jgi:hypothetical protein
VSRQPWPREYGGIFVSAWPKFLIYLSNNILQGSEVPTLAKQSQGAAGVEVAVLGVLQKSYDPQFRWSFFRQENQIKRKRFWLPERFCVGQIIPSQLPKAAATHAGPDGQLADALSSYVSGATIAVTKVNHSCEPRTADIPEGRKVLCDMRTRLTFL